MKKDLKFFKNLLPPRITVNIKKDENGLWASIEEIPFCYTQAINATQLTEMLNDAIFTHFEIPADIRVNVGYYAPITIAHEKIEEMFRKLVAIEEKISAGQEAEETFNLTNDCVCM
jgi:predicted RNase H-like HicB family nuclease